MQSPSHPTDSGGQQYQAPPPPPAAGAYAPGFALPPNPGDSGPPPAPYPGRGPVFGYAPGDYGPWDPEHLDHRLAAPGARFGARLLDLVLVGVIWYIGMLVATGAGMVAGGGDLDTQPANGLFIVLSTANFLLLPICLEWVQVRLWGRTLGKRIVGLWVVRLVDGKRVTTGRALLRALCFAPGHTNPIAWLLPWTFTNLLWQFHDRNRRCLHDLAAGSVVVTTPPQ